MANVNRGTLDSRPPYQLEDHMMSYNIPSQLACRNSGDAPAISLWIAMSLLQKAIRRGQAREAMLAAKALITVSPSHLTRRLCVTAFEDIGAGDPETVAAVVTVLGDRASRERLYSDLPSLTQLLGLMCKAGKCRATDDLVSVCEHHEALNSLRTPLGSASNEQLIENIASESDLSIQALALWYLLGTTFMTPPSMVRRSGSRPVVLEALCRAGAAGATVDLVREGLRQGGGLVAALYGLASAAQGHSPSSSMAAFVDDNVPPERLVAGVPSWVFDVHVREGNRAMAAFVDVASETSRWLACHFPRGKRAQRLGGMLFRVESGVVRRRFRWPLADDLRRMADLEVHGVTPSNAEQGLGLLCQDMGLLNEVRAHVIPNLR